MQKSTLNYQKGNKITLQRRSLMALAQISLFINVAVVQEGGGNEEMRVCSVIVIFYVSKTRKIIN